MREVGFSVCCCCCDSISITCRCQLELGIQIRATNEMSTSIRITRPTAEMPVLRLSEHSYGNVSANQQTRKVTFNIHSSTASFSFRSSVKSYPLQALTTNCFTSSSLLYLLNIHLPRSLFAASPRLFSANSPFITCRTFHSRSGSRGKPLTHILSVVLSQHMSRMDLGHLVKCAWSAIQKAARYSLFFEWEIIEDCERVVMTQKLEGAIQTIQNWRGSRKT